MDVVVVLISRSCFADTVVNSHVKRSNLHISLSDVVVLYLTLRVSFPPLLFFFPLGRSGQGSLKEAKVS